MTLTEYLGKDKEKLLTSFAQAQTPEAVIPLVEAEFDRLLYEYNENELGDHERRYVSGMLQTARMAAPFLECLGETKIWEQGGKLLNDEKKRIRFIAVVLLFAGIFLSSAVLIAISGIDRVLEEMARMPVLIAGSILGVVCLFAAGFLFVKRNKATYSEKQLKAENRIDAGKVYQAMHSILMIIDRNIDELTSAEKAEKLKDEKKDIYTYDSDELELYGDLLEAYRSKDGEYALDQLSKLSFYLHKKDIEMLEYSDDKRSFFDMIPGERNETVRPALLKEGHLLKKGVVSGGRQ
ncbi:MAG: hypothetical protein IKF68_05710 [Erysipelotrichaceae bacterium]|nr:hypothetical protein [Erysipelotrichaceae bacterium]